LVAQSRAPHRQPRKTSPEIEQQVVELRRTLPTFGARRLIREFDLPLSHRALERIWRAHGLLKKCRRKYQRKQDLAAIKATWRLFQQISADTKDLDDILHYWSQAWQLGLPAVQYTAREVRSGLLFLAFTNRLSATASSVFAARIQRHLDRYGIDLRDLFPAFLIELGQVGLTGCGAKQTCSTFTGRRLRGKPSSRACSPEAAKPSPARYPEVVAKFRVQIQFVRRSALQRSDTQARCRVECQLVSCRVLGTKWWIEGISEPLPIGEKA
jgi:hypothetical protein